jgi:hypothetical protein
MQRPSPGVRWSAWFLWLVLGCQGSQPMMDPFGTSGPTRIPPPPTGSAGRPDPYYRRSLAEAPTDESPRVGALPLPATRRFTSDQPANERPSAEPPRDRSGLDWRSPTPTTWDDGNSYDGPQPRPRFPGTSVPAANYQAVEPNGLDPWIVQDARQLPARSPSNTWNGSYDAGASQPASATLPERSWARRY